MALRLRGATSGYIELKAPASAGDNTLTLPTNNGVAHTFLKTDGSGNLSWQSNLTFDGTNLLVNGTMLNAVQLKFGNSGTAYIDHNIVGQDFYFRVGNSSALDTTALVIKSDGNVGIGTATPGHKLAIAGGASNQLEVKGTEADIWLNSTGPNAVWRILGSTGGNTHRFRIYDNTNGKEPFYIIGSSGSNTQHVHVNSGNLVFDAAGTGIDFSATSDGSVSSISEILSDYEQGEWTPSITSGGWTSLGASAVGHYTKVGNIVHVSIANGALTGSGDATTLKIGGLPFPVAAWTPGSMYAQAYNSEGTDQATIAASGAAGSNTELRVVEWGVEAQGNDFGAGYFVVQVSYRTT